MSLITVCDQADCYNMDTNYNKPFLGVTKDFTIVFNEFGIYDDICQDCADEMILEDDNIFINDGDLDVRSTKGKNEPNQ